MRDARVLPDGRPRSDDLARLNACRFGQRDLSALKGNRFEKLKGDRAGSYSIRINDQWTITFRIENNQALDVTIEDYH